MLRNEAEVAVFVVRDSPAVWRLLRTYCSRVTSEGYTYGKQRYLPLQLWSAHFHVRRQRNLGLLFLLCLISQVLWVYI